MPRTRVCSAGDGGRPSKAEGAEVGDGGNGAAGGVGGELALARQLDELIVGPDQVLEALGVGVANHRTSTPSSASTAKPTSIEEG